MKNSQKGSATTIVLIVVIALLVIAGGIYLYKNNTATVPVSVNTGTQQSDQVQQQIASTTTEKASGIIKSVYSKSGKNYIDIDYVEFVAGGPDGSRTINNNPQIRTFEISPNAKFIVGSPATTPVTFQEFSNLFISTGIINGVSTDYQKYNPWDIVIVNGAVTQITEHFVP